MKINQDLADKNSYMRQNTCATNRCILYLIIGIIHRAKEESIYLESMVIENGKNADKTKRWIGKICF